MPLIDAMRSGVDLANASNQGVVTSAQARYAYPQAKYDLEKSRLSNIHQGLINQYYGPEHQAAIDYQNIINKYQPEKSRLGNENQALVNKYYAPNIQSEINARDAETQFTPLKYAIQAENSIRNNSRFGGAYQYLKSVADLPAEQRSVFLGNPDNYQQYMDMIQQLHGSVSSGQGSSSLITPALLKRVGLESLSQDLVGAPAPKGVVVSPAQTGGLAAPMPGVAQNQPMMANAQPQGAPPMPSAPPQGGGGMAAPIPGMAPPSAPPMMRPPQGGGMPPMAAPGMPPQMGQGQGAPMPSPVSPNGQIAPQAPPLTPQAASVASQSGVTPQEGNAAANDAKNPVLTPAKKQLLGFQMTANKKQVGQYMTNRALGGVTLHSLLVDNQDRFAPAFENATKYAGLLGAGKLTMDKFKSEHPAEYSDYMWVTQDLVPNISNNVKVMEGLSSTDTQRNALNEMLNSVLHWDSDPKMAVKNINKTIGLLKAQADASLKTAQPMYPGVLEQLYGIKEGAGDYVGANRTTQAQQAKLKEMSTDELLKMYQGAK